MKEVIKMNSYTGIVIPQLFMKGKSSCYLSIYQELWQQYHFTAHQIDTLMKPTEKWLEYYDFENFLFFSFTKDGFIYKCDLSYMFDLLNKKYKISMLGEVTGLPDKFKDDYNLENCKMIVRKSTVYFFLGKKGEPFMTILKGKIDNLDSGENKI